MAKIVITKDNIEEIRKQLGKGNYYWVRYDKNKEFEVAHWRSSFNSTAIDFFFSNGSRLGLHGIYEIVLPQIPYPSPEEAGKEMESETFDPIYKWETLLKHDLKEDTTYGIKVLYEILNDFKNQSRPQPLNEEEINYLAEKAAAKKYRILDSLYEVFDSNNPSPLCKRKLYIEGFKSGIQSKAVPDSEWISIEDKLPEIGVDVLACNSDSDIIWISFIRHNFKTLNCSGFLIATHWMPLPEKPIFKS